ncbi:MAG: entericidin A/B family lipoprotein [Desulfamplus sp.]|nr:entericidin A/B family lipoprotein [Desulfamplus sp.]
MKKVVMILFALFFVLFSIEGCNTVKGVGKDIEKAGEAIQRSAK